MKTISINGRFLAQPLTGVQRFARELTQALDRRIAAGEVPPHLLGSSWRLILPEGADDGFALEAIRIERVGRGHRIAASDSLAGWWGWPNRFR